GLAEVGRSLALAELLPLGDRGALAARRALVLGAAVAVVAGRLARGGLGGGGAAGAVGPGADAHGLGGGADLTTCRRAQPRGTDRGQRNRRGAVGAGRRRRVASGDRCAR